MAYSFHEIQFPKKISYGSKGGPGFFTKITQTEAAHEHAVARRSTARHEYDISYGIHSYEDLAEVKAFFLARGGAANGFRLSDPFDMNSHPTNPSYNSNLVGVQDQRIGVGNGSATAFQLIKTYTSGPTSYVRQITKPVSGTVQIWLNSVLQSSGYSVDNTTGIITFSSPPGNGVLIDASFEFDVPVRFGEDADRALSAQASSHGSGDIDSISVIELMSSTSSGNLTEYFYGGAYEEVISVNKTMSTGLGRLWVISASVGGLSVLCPDPSALPGGGIYFRVVNGGSNTFTVKDSGGTTIATLTSGQTIDVVLSLTSGGTKVWYAV